MKIGSAVLAQWNGWETGGNRMTEGEKGGEGEEKGQGKKTVRGVGRKESKNKAVAEKQEFRGSVA